MPLLTIMTVLPSLTHSCAYCPKTTQLNICSKCKVVQYCGRDHQAADWPIHKALCKKIGKYKAELQAERDEEAMFSSLAGRLDPALVKHCKGGDVDVLLKLATAELELDTRLAVQSALGHVLAMTRNAKTSMLGTADLPIACFLRLGQDQEAYDYMKWWITTPETLLRPPKQPYTAVKNEDGLESVDVFMGRCPSIAFMAALTLFKLRLLMDLQAIQRSRQAVSSDLPQELLDEIRKNMVSSAITIDLIERDNHEEAISGLAKDIKTLYGAIRISNKQLWPGILHPTDDLIMNENIWGEESKREHGLALKHTYKAWVETPGAVDAIKALSKDY
ncbi:hypothetical protein BCR34DRAFT_545017 [Clohesyomyces aquaticus]|uniref:MYND-type domain-containing protein n=1 Tax=Clohesyomyces aquaticus TaxID=1231657 RepID=A0A1Y1Z073_9PLEO|nr:hypothetical protein BCR34DRAFT_545017 [Clohesyomyces aquaticus]